EKYNRGSEVAKLIKRIEFEKNRLMVRGEDASKSKKVRELESSLVKKEEKLASINAKVEVMKDGLRSNARFDEFESKLDDGIDLSSLNKKEMRRLRNDLQIIFQDPYSSLDPRFTVGNIIGE